MEVGENGAPASGNIHINVLEEAMHDFFNALAG
jgi:hypothetical protein